MYLGTIGIKGNTRGFWIYVGSGTCFDLYIRRYTRIYGGSYGVIRKHLGLEGKLVA